MKRIFWPYLICAFFLVGCSLTNRLTSLISPTPTPTPTEQACIAAPAGLVSWWPGDGETTDIRGENDGSFQDGAGYAEGKVGSAFSFDGFSRMAAPTTDLPTGQADRTVDLWMKANAFYEGEAFLAGYGQFGSASASYHLGTAGSTLFFSQWGDAIFGPSLQTDRWYHVAVTNSGRLVTLYLDGVEVAVGNMDINTPNGSTFYLGNIPWEGQKRLNGLVDEVEVYNRALSAEEIKAIYTAGSGGKCKE